MELISRDELKAKLDRGDNFKLVMVMAEWAFQAQHIPGSIYINRLHDVAGWDQNEEIVVYCTGGACLASRTAYDYLVKKKGFTHVRRYAGGLEDWAEAGYPLEGDLVEER